MDTECNIRIRKIEQIVESSQLNRGTHVKYLKLLHQTYENTDFDEFFNSLMYMLCGLFIQDTKVKNGFINRAIEFLAKFSASLADENENIFLQKLIKSVLKYHNAESHNVRFRVCEFIKIILNNLVDNIDIDNVIFDEILPVMQERINDIKPNVRMEAVQALQRLQDPNDPDDPVRNTYLKYLSIEYNSQIRKTLVQCIGPSIITVPVFLKRCLDKDDSVRLTAFQKFSKIPVRILKLEQRQFLLRNGFRSKNPLIIQFISENLLPRWLSYYNENYFEFLKALKLDAVEEEMKQTVELLENVLDTFFRTKPLKEMLAAIPLNEEKIISAQELTFETSLFWSRLIKYIYSHKDEYGEECIDQITPDLTEFVKYIQSYYKTIDPKADWNFLVQNQILSELLKIITIYDMLDEMERKNTHKMVVDFLTDAKITYDNILLLTNILEKIIPDVNERSIEICYIISNIREPLVQTAPTKEQETKRDLKLAPFKVKVNIMNEDLETAIKEQQFQKAEELKNEIANAKKQMEIIRAESESIATSVRVAKNDSYTILKCLDILIALLQSSQFKELTGALRTIMDQFLKMILLTMDPSVHCKALKCYALFCYMDKKEATNSLQLFCTQILAYRYISTYNQATIIVSASSIVDLLMLYGTTIFGDEELSENEENSKRKTGSRLLYDDTQIEETLPNLPAKASLNDIVEILSEMLDDTELEMREVAGVSLIKLFANDIIKSASLLSKLILKWFNPATAKDVALRQMLGIFFPDYVMKIPNSLLIVEQAFLPTLCAIVNAPKTSPLIDVNIEAILKFLVELSRSHKRYNENLDAHKNLAVKMCNEICNKPHNKCVPIFLRTLLLLDLPTDDEIIMEDLRNQATVMLELITDKTQKKQVQKYILRLRGFEMENTEQITNDQINFTNNTTEITKNGEISTNGEVTINRTIVSGKRKRSNSYGSFENRNIGNKTALQSIPEKSGENGSISDDDMTIESVTSDNDSAADPKNLDNLAIKDITLNDTSIKSNEVEEYAPRRSLRKSARRK